MRDVPSNTGSLVPMASLVALWADSSPLVMPLSLVTLYWTVHRPSGAMYLLNALVLGKRVSFWFRFTKFFCNNYCKGFLKNKQSKVESETLLEDSMLHFFVNTNNLPQQIELEFPTCDTWSTWIIQTGFTWLWQLAFLKQARRTTWHRYCCKAFLKKMLHSHKFYI